jgi:hypothetical protein
MNLNVFFIDIIEVRKDGEDKTQRIPVDDGRFGIELV